MRQAIAFFALRRLPLWLSVMILVFEVAGVILWWQGAAHAR